MQSRILKVVKFGQEGTVFKVTNKGHISATEVYIIKN